MSRTPSELADRKYFAESGGIPCTCLFFFSHTIKMQTETLGYQGKRKFDRKIDYAINTGAILICMATIFATHQILLASWPVFLFSGMSITFVAAVLRFFKIYILRV